MHGPPPKPLPPCWSDKEIRRNKFRKKNRFKQRKIRVVRKRSETREVEVWTETLLKEFTLKYHVSSQQEAGNVWRLWHEVKDGYLWTSRNSSKVLKTCLNIKKRKREWSPATVMLKCATPLGHLWWRRVILLRLQYFCRYRSRASIM